MVHQQKKGGDNVQNNSKEYFTLQLFQIHLSKDVLYGNNTGIEVTTFRLLNQTNKMRKADDSMHPLFV